MKVWGLIEKILDQIDVEYVEILFLIDKENRNLAKLSPGETVGVKGLALGVIITDLIDAANHLDTASKRLEQLLRRAKDEANCENRVGDIVINHDDLGDCRLQSK